MRIESKTEQSEPIYPPRETLPTMYDLPSEDPEEPGLPDEFHDLQPELLRWTFAPPNYPPERLFCGSDMNLYYDVSHTNWYKRPDWFGVVGVSRFYDGRDLRLSYVIWQERVTPAVVVELLSPGTEDEDLGKTTRRESEPPTKWEVYQDILQIPYYVVFDRSTNHLQAFMLVDGLYQEIDVSGGRVWIGSVGLGLGLWQGAYQGINRHWLRWYDASGNWISTPEERAATAIAELENTQTQLEAERQRMQRLEELLRSQGIDPDSLA